MAYFSNGSEGMALDAQCAECPIGRHINAICPVLLAQSTFNYKQFTDGNPNTVADVLNTLINEDGICQMKPVIEKFAALPTGGREVATGGTVIPAMQEWAKQRGLVKK